MTWAVPVSLTRAAVPAVFCYRNYAALVSIRLGSWTLVYCHADGLHFTSGGYKSGQVVTDKTEEGKKTNPEAGRRKFKAV